MLLNDIKPKPGSKKNHVRVGRGIGSGLGKTCGRGHKGQKSRSGGFHKLGFEGGQMPLQRRLPKRGFTSNVVKTHASLRLDQLNKIEAEKVTVQSIRQAGLINSAIKTIKIFKAGNITKALVVSPEIRVSSGAKEAIESAGGKVETDNG